MVYTRRNGQPNGGPDEEAGIPNLEAMVAAAISNMLPGLNANESFSKLNPFSFISAASPKEADDWITHMEKIFEVLGCGDEFKPRLATFKLEGDALNWWKAHNLAKGGDIYMTTCTWAEFRNTFYKRYFPDSEQQRLASFVGPIAGDASRQAKHFKWGLKKWVLDRLLNTEFADVSAVNDAARNIEIFHEVSGYNKRNRDGDRIHPRVQDKDNKGYSCRSHDQRGQDLKGHDQRHTTRSVYDRQHNYNSRDQNHEGKKIGLNNPAVDLDLQTKRRDGTRLEIQLVLYAGNFT
ncbi:reverse transcriptase domain-containing protein [Artemisia annua]|uniref:Reverse transcriptase domain-containing protein n=1 Tax=Artemisia annua TaxID=35608 RepID=A0A2U1MLC0_ARTAN|nr:reverse transcriptase domain-containing protein [Artemisia annua]